MKRIFVLGTLLAVFTFLAVVLGSWAQLGLDNVLFATGCGALLGLIPDKSPGVRIGAFFLGFFIGALGYLFRAAVLPDSYLAQGIAAFFGIMIVTLICGLTRGRLPFWGAILGLIAITGAYNATFTAAPYDFIQSALATIGSLLLCAGVGMLAIVLGQLIVGSEEADEPAATEPKVPGSEPTSANERPIVNVNG
ncbi:MAG: hypothetical protein HQ526_00850 [Actinobacteria bacterium]|nr:hypothetical protein [Actinomycetota bacterium]